MLLSETQIKNILKRIVLKLIKDVRLNEDKDTLDAIITKECEEEMVMVMHEKDSYSKYGDATEYGFDSWKDYCYKYSHYKKLLQSIKRCPCCGKPMIDTDGAHVINPISREVFITPTCSGCNSTAAKDEYFRRTHRFSVKVKYLVPFNYSELKKQRRSK